MRKINRQRYKKNKMIIVISILLVLSLSIGYSAFNTNLSINTKGNLKQSVWNFDYTGSEQTFTVPKTGNYKIELWGAQGGYFPSLHDKESGMGGYAIGNIKLEKNEKLYINVGGKGTISYNDTSYGGYNGGGDAIKGPSGGGATHIAKLSGLLSSLENKKDQILIAAGAGAGVDTGGKGGNGGGFKGTNGSDSSAIQGMQESTTIESDYAGKFGMGGKSGCKLNSYFNISDCGGAGGSGFYGGFGNSGSNGVGGGGSGYIGNTLLKEKHMSCYNCEESNEESTKTISVTCAKEEPTEDCAKIGNGYTRIIYLGNK